jgi:hypothetical protein
MSPPASNEDQKCSSYINGVITGVLVDQVAREQGTGICLPDRALVFAASATVAMDGHPSGD